MVFKLFANACKTWLSIKTEPLMKRIHILIAFSVLVFGVACTPENEVPQNPNIIYVLADDLGYGDIGAFNEQSKIKTPNIDKMAAEGIMFTDAHTSSSVCTPTRYGLLTGRYNWRTRLKEGVLTGKSKALIPNSRTTVASLLQAHGYYTAFFGKWHLGLDWALKNTDDNKGDGWDPADFDNIDFSKPVKNSPNTLGFDYAYGHPASLDMAPYVYVENEMVTQVPDSMSENTGKYSWWRKGPTSDDFVHDDVTPNFFRRSIQFINERSKEDSPFFLYLALPSPHTPILPTAEWQDKSGLNPYGDFVMMIDNYMGELEKAVKDAGIENNTLIIFTSDNGCAPAAKTDELEEKGHYPSSIFRGYKADIYEGGHRVPFVVKWPDKIKAGRVSDETICLTDFMATCAEIVGYSLSDNEGEDSFSLVPVFEDVKRNKPLREGTVHHSVNGCFAIRKGDWKLIMCPGSGGWSFPRPGNKAVIDSLPKYQLYNLKTDPGETENLQATTAPKVEELRSLLIKYINEGRSTPGIPQKNDSIDFEWKQIDFVNR